MSSRTAVQVRPARAQMLDSEFVRAVCELREKMQCAPTTGDVAAQMGIDRTTAWRRLRANPALFAVPGRPAPRWHVRDGMTGSAARIAELVREASALARGLDAETAAALRAEILGALEVGHG